MKKLIAKLLSNGYKSDSIADESKIYAITNFILLLAAFVAFLRIFVFFYTGDISFALVSLFSSIAFISLYIMNTKGYHDFAKYALLFVGNLATGYKELTTGGEAGQIYLILASFGVVFLLFDIKDTKKFLLGLLFPTLNLLLNLILPLVNPEIAEKIIVSMHSSIRLSNEIILKNKVTGVISNVVISVLIIWYFVKKSNDKEAQLIANNELLNKTNLDLEMQKGIIQQQNEEIYASIRYAERIQNAILPWEESMNEAFQNYFIIYKPKDIVSGDFYWLHKKDDIAYFAICDCTGHGISGSMLSMIGSAILEEAVTTKNLNDTDEILKYFDYKLTIALNQQIVNNKSRDSIEVGLVKISKDKIEFSGARNNLYYFYDDSLKIIKGDRISIGGDAIAGDDYTKHSIENKRNTMIYLTTDGFIDQVGSNGKKYGSKRLKEVMEEISSLELNKQKLYFENELFTHKGNEEQRDDITLVGIRTN